ncbi:MAG: DNA mismatch repair endonuclease MutL [Acidobacteria bacterium]|nr:DNA mismatch repair endonuclease MutL [Acidobacteriota bacterium]
MGRIRVLSDQVANQIAAGEVVERPASVVKELLENAIDAGATRVRVDVEAGGRKLIRIEDNGTGMVRDDAMLAFERHATSKLRTSDDLLEISTLGFRGEALPSIASVARVELETRAAEDEVGTRIEIAGGNMLHVDDVGRPQGTTIAVKDLFFNTPARKKFLKSESTELSHVAALVTHYALAHPDKHFELHTTTHALLVAPAVNNAGERLFQIFGADTFREMIPTAAEIDFQRAGVPEPPPWKRAEDYEPPEPGFLRIRGFVSKPELQKLNRNSIYVFVNGRQVRDRVMLHAMSEAYRNLIPPTSFPVVLLFLEMPPKEVDVNVHPAKTEVRFRQSAFVHDFVRDTVRNAVMKAKPAISFATALNAAPRASESLLLDVGAMAVGNVPWSEALPSDEEQKAMEEAKRVSEPINADDVGSFSLTEKALPAEPGKFEFNESIRISPAAAGLNAEEVEEEMRAAEEETPQTLNALGSLKPLGQLKDSFILAANEEGLWIIDQHVAHERVLFEKHVKSRTAELVQRQRLLMPVLIDLLPEQMAAFAQMADELERNGFEAEPFGPRTLAIKAAPIGLEGKHLELTLGELLQVDERTHQAENTEARRMRVAASIACHAAIKINTPLPAEKIEWLLQELGKTENPMSCPHGRPIALRYSHKDIQRAFQRI